MIKYKIDIMTALKEHGINYYSCRRDSPERLFAQGTLTRIRDNKSVTLDTIDKLCRVLGLQPGDLLEYIPDDEQN